MKVVLEKIRYKNILSAGNMWIEIDYLRSPSTLVTGKNGSGKSLGITDALIFGLFGTTFRKINLNQLVNNKNKKELLVEVYFTSNNVKYHIRRGIKPAVFEIYKEGVLIDQDAGIKGYQQMLEHNILGFDYNTFTQVMVISKTNYVSFMKMVPSQRRQFLESLLGLDIISLMGVNHKKNLDDLKQETTENKTQLQLTKEKIELKKGHIYGLETSLKTKQKKFEEKNQEKIITLQQEIQTLTEQYKTIELFDYDSEMKTIDKKLAEYKKGRDQGNQKYKRVLSNIEFFEKNVTCPECGQSISDEFKKSKIEILKNTVGTLDNSLKTVYNKIEELNNVLGDLALKQKQEEQKQNQITEIHNKIRSNQKLIRSLENEKLDGIEEDKKLIEKEKEALEMFEEMYQGLQDERVDLLTRQEHFDIVTMMLKDNGIKGMVLKRFIPLINKTVTDYMGKFGFFARFEIDEEFNERILHRGMNDMNYYNFSEGEKLRIDMAVMMAWREVARMKSNIQCNLFVLDEIHDGSMDNEGVAAFNELISMSKDLNVFVITHSPEKMAETFRSQLVFGRVDGFSKII